MKQPAMPYKVTIYYPIDRSYDTLAAVQYITDVTKWCEQQGLCLVNDFGVDSLSGNRGMSTVNTKQHSLSWHFKFRTHQHATMFKLRWGGT